MGDRDEALELGIRHDCGGSTFRVHPDGAVICIECNTELSGYVLVERQALEQQRARIHNLELALRTSTHFLEQDNAPPLGRAARAQANHDLLAAPEANDG